RGHRRPGRDELADPQLPGLSGRGERRGSGGAGLHSGMEFRRRIRLREPGDRAAGPRAGAGGWGGRGERGLEPGGRPRPRGVLPRGVSYRRLGIPSLDGVSGAGVFYGAATSEATAMKDREVFVVGGANSAGQAAVHLARYAAKVTVLVRGQSLAEGMSDYLITQIASTPNIAVRHNVAVTGGGGTDCLESLTLQDRVSRTTETIPAAAMFVLIGAEPHTQWLPDHIARDQWGFVVTGTDLLAGGAPPQGW